MLSNAAVAAVLAVFAAALEYFVRAPAVRNAAWVLVLLKLVTPPLVSLPLPVLPVLPVSWAPDPESSRCVAGAFSVSRPNTESVSAPPTRHAGPSVTDVILLAWTFGALGWFIWQGRRIIRFRRRVRAAEDAPTEIQAAATRLAKALGISRPPPVKVAAGLGSPMLWGWGRTAVVLLPRDLLPRLAAEARDTLLAHEFAHFLRRDHWVRILEYVATGLYWWHPAVWLARAGVEAAEEECCDAWVVGGLSASPRRYAEALLATVDFEAELRRPCLPAGATAASRGARLLHRRLVRIIDADRAPRLPYAAAVYVAIAAVLLTRPILIAAAPVAVPTEITRAPVVITKHPVTSVSPSPKPRVREPRAWAAVTAPGGDYVVLARDHEMILRYPDGIDRVLGPGRPYAVAFAPGGTKLATTGPGPLVRIWDDQARLLAESRAHAVARAITYTPDGGRLLVLDAAGGISVFDPETLARSACLHVDGPANSIACDPNGQTVVVSFGSWQAEDGWVECWSIPERRRLARYTAPAPVGASRFSPEGARLVIGGWNGRTIWRLLPGGEFYTERLLPKEAVADAAFSPDADTLPSEPPEESTPVPDPRVPGALIDLLSPRESLTGPTTASPNRVDQAPDR
jgi:beta-lactamase regulating signal transducer with metallopeptidase domain